MLFQVLDFEKLRIYKIENDHRLLQAEWSIKRKQPFTSCAT